MYLDNLNLGISYPDFDYWVKDGIVSKQLGVRVAPEDLWVQCDDDRKEYWTYEEYKELETKLLIPNGWRLPTDEEWLVLLKEFGTNMFGDTDHRCLMSSLGLKYGGYIKENDILAYNSFPNDPFYVHNLGLGGYYLTSNSPLGDTDTDNAVSRYLFFLKEYDAKYSYDYIGISGVLVKEAYAARCIAIQ